MFMRSRGLLPLGGVFVLLLSALAACESNATEPEMRIPEGPRMFTGADSAYVVALEARVAALEAAVSVTTGEQISMRVSNSEVLRMEYASGGARSSHFTGPVGVSASSTGTGLSVTDSNVYFGSNGFDAISSLAKNETALRVTWAKQALLGGMTYPVAQVLVGGADSGGVGYRVLRIAN